MSFSDVIGQEAAVRVLRDELKMGRVNHAYLFTGKEGVGKKTLAFQFARALLCEEKNDDCCDVCLSCRRIDHSNHPDVKFVVPEEGSKNIKIAQVREMQREVSLKPYEGERKVYIIEDVERMTLQAANSMLKTLEEPPSYAVIILLAEEISKLLSTVVSRCQRVRLYDISREKICNFLASRGVEERRARLLAGLAGGSIGRALSLEGDEDFIDAREEVFSFFKNLPGMKNVDIVEACDKMTGLIRDDFPFFDLVFSWFRDLLFYQQGNRDGIMNIDYGESLEEHSSCYSTEEVLGIIELINKIQNGIERNVRKDLSLLVLLLKIRSKRV
ncbi:MAG: DNA polymerase III subunit delta' [Halanaerobiaceae bacterium]